MISSLNLRNFRIFESEELHFDSSSVIISGANGQGKTTVLEALYYLSILRSFRSSRLSEMTRLGTASMSLSAVLNSRAKGKILLEAEHEGTARRLRIDHETIARASEFTGVFRTVAFLPDDPEIITGASALRRRFFDMFLSMLDREYFNSLQQYSAALKARNCVLRATMQHGKALDRDLLEAYHPLLAKHGSAILRGRMFYLRILNDFMKHILETIRPDLSDFEIRMRAVREAGEETEFLKRLESGMERDILKRYTQFGPHGDDFEFLAFKRSLRLYGSRGQCRIVSFALKLAQYEILRSSCSNAAETVVLVDDATGDLDKKACDAFFERIKDAGQVFYAFAGLNDRRLADLSQIITVSGGRAN